MCGCIERYNQKERATQPTPFLIETFCERAFNELTVSFKIHQSNNNFKIKKKKFPTYLPCLEKLGRVRGNKQLFMDGLKYLIQFDGQNIQKNFYFDTFLLIFALFAVLKTPYTVPNFSYFVLFVQITSYYYEL